MKKKFLLAILIFSLVFSSFSIETTYAVSNYKNKPQVSATGNGTFMNPIGQYTRAYYCFEDGNYIPIQGLSSVLWYNYNYNDYFDRTGQSIPYATKGHVLPAKTTEAVTVKDNSLYSLGLKAVWSGINQYSETISLHPMNFSTNNQSYIKYDLVLGEENIKINNGLTPLTDSYGTVMHTLEKVYKINDNDALQKAFGESINQTYFVGESVSLYTGDSFPAVFGYSSETSSGLPRVHKRYDFSYENIILYKHIMTKKAHESASSYGHTPTGEPTNYTNMFFNKVSSDSSRIYDLTTKFSSVTRNFDITYPWSAEYASMYKFSTDYGAFLLYGNIPVPSFEGMNVYKLNEIFEIDNTTKRLLQCDSSGLRFIVVGVKSVFKDVYQPWTVGYKTNEVGYHDGSPPPAPTPTPTPTPTPEPTPTPAPIINVNVPNISFNISDITNSDVGFDPNSNNIGNTDASTFENSIILEDKISAEIINIPSNGKVVSGDSYFSPKITIHNRGKKANLLVDTIASNSTEYSNSQWQNYDSTNTITDLVLYKANEILSKTTLADITYDKLKNTANLTKVDEKLNISKTTDFSKFNIKENGTYLIGVNTRDKENADKKSQIVRSFELTFNDNEGSLPVKNNLNFLINNKEVLLNKKRTSIGLTNMNKEGYNSLQISSATNLKGETLIANTKNNIIIFDKDLNKKTSSSIMRVTKTHDVEAFKNNFLISTNLGLYIRRDSDNSTLRLEGISGEVKDLTISNGYMIAAMHNWIGVLNLNSEETRVDYGAFEMVTYTPSKIEDLGNKVVVTEENSSKIRIYSKR